MQEDSSTGGWEYDCRQEGIVRVLLKDHYSSRNFIAIFSTDVVIVGGGNAGMITAHLVRRACKSIAVIDHGNVVSGETGRTAAHIPYALDDR